MEITKIQEKRAIRLGVKLGQKIISVIADKSDKIKNQKGIIRAHCLFNAIQAKESEFVFALEFLKKTHLKIYEYLDVPPKWDGSQSSVYYTVFNDFLEECCVLGDYEPISINPSNEFWTYKSDLTRAFNDWLEDREFSAITTSRLTKIIKWNDKIQIQTRRINGKPIKVYAGVRLRS